VGDCLAAGGRHQESEHDPELARGGRRERGPPDHALPAPADRRDLVGDDPLLDPSTKEEVGRLLFECFRVDTGSSLFHCPGNTIVLTGRGRIVYTEDVHFAAGYTSDPWPITGGTGEFVDATGTVTSPADSTYTDGGDFVIAIDG
jgi:hypothetical protein